MKVWILEVYSSKRATGVIMERKERDLVTPVYLNGEARGSRASSKFASARVRAWCVCVCECKIFTSL